MKLRSGRKYKNGLSDIIGVLGEHERRGDPISKDRIDMAVRNLYGGWGGFRRIRFPLSMMHFETAPSLSSE